MYGHYLLLLHFFNEFISYVNFEDILCVNADKITVLSPYYTSQFHVLKLGKFITTEHTYFHSLKIQRLLRWMSFYWNAFMQIIWTFPKEKIT